MTRSKKKEIEKLAYNLRKIGIDSVCVYLDRTWKLHLWDKEEPSLLHIEVTLNSANSVIAMMKAVMLGYLVHQSPFERSFAPFDKDVFEKEGKPERRHEDHPVG